MDTIFFKNKPRIISTGSIVGPKESAGEVGKYVDLALKEDTFGEKSFEKSECKMLSFAISKSMEKANLSEHDINLLISGDLLNQIISASFSARNFDFSFLGVYGACSTMAESMAIGATFIDAGHYKNVISATGSHFSTAERQYRFPLELGNTRPPQSQWTVTGAGSCVISNAFDKKKSSCYPAITSATFGKVVDYGVTDVNNMGAAMAPSCLMTIVNHLRDSKKDASYYDLIVTGDLGALGSRLLKDLLWEKGIDVDNNHVDCGEIIYNIAETEYQGGSGAGCSAVVLNSYIYDKLIKRKINKVLFVATGALLSTTSSGQGESIPCISHAVSIEND